MEVELVFLKGGEGRRIFFTLQGEPKDIKSAEKLLIDAHTDGGWILENQNIRPQIIRNVKHIKHTI